MTDKPDDPDPPSYPPPQFAPAAPPSGPDSYPPPQFAPAAPSSGPDSYPPPQFAPATPAPPSGPDNYPPPQFAPATQPSGATSSGDTSPTWDTYSPPQFAPTEPAAAAPIASSGTVEVSGATSSRATSSGASRATSSAASSAEEPLLPAEYRENDLRAAIGSPPMPEHIRPKRARPPDADDADDGGRPRSRKTMLVIAASLFTGLSIAVLVILGRVNSASYVLSCEAKQVVAEQGRSFPPWGTSRLGGDEWKPIKIPASFPCNPTETEDPAELGDAYRKLLVDRAEAMLTAREVVQLEDVAGMLEQALLHARSDSDAHKTARQHIQRLLGDVGYWRASAKLQEATKSLTEAAKEFETAAAQLPRHVADANAWATYVRRLIDELRAGPSGARPLASAPTPAPPPERALAPAGVALPVEPAAGSGSGATEPPPPQPDAGIPSGGVLL